MVVAGDFKNGITFECEGSVLQVIEFQHVKPGKGAAFVRTKLKNVITGAVTERTFSPTDKFENAYVERKDMQYSYDDGHRNLGGDFGGSFPGGRQLQVRQGGNDVQDRFLQGQCLCRGASYLCGVGGYRHRPRICRKYGYQHLEARHTGNRRRNQSAALYQCG